MSKRVVFAVLLVTFLVMAVPGLAAASDFIRPVEGKILRTFEKDTHRGVDIEAAEGTRVKAAISGTVSYVGYSEGSSSNLFHTLSIAYGDAGYHTTYLQIKPLVSEGDSVVQGQEIGEVIKSTDEDDKSSHLHFGVWQKDASGTKTYLNPLDFLPQLMQPEAEAEMGQAAAVQPVPAMQTGEPVVSGSGSVLPTPNSTPAQETVKSSQPESGAMTVLSPASSQASQQAVPALPPALEESRDLSEPRQEKIVSGPTQIFAASIDTGIKVRASSQTPGVAAPTPQSQTPESQIVSRLPAVMDQQSRVVTLPTPSILASPAAAAISIGILKDRQLESLRLDPVTQESTPPVTRLSEKAFEVQPAAFGRSFLGWGAHLGTVSRLLSYVLLLISIFSLTRVPKGEFGSPAHV